jgi:hypothetical protein
VIAGVAALGAWAAGRAAAGGAGAAPTSAPAPADEAPPLAPSAAPPVGAAPRERLRPGRERPPARQPEALPTHDVGLRAYQKALRDGDKTPGETAFRAEAKAFFDHNAQIAAEKAAKKGISVGELSELTYLGLLGMYLQRWDQVDQVAKKPLSPEDRGRGEELVVAASDALKATLDADVAKGSDEEARWQTIRTHEAKFLEQYRALTGLSPEEFDRLLALSFEAQGDKPPAPLRPYALSARAPAQAPATRARLHPRARSRGLPLRLFFGVQGALFVVGPPHARPLEQAPIISADRRVVGQRDVGHERPVEHRHQVGVGDAEAVDQKLAAREVAVEQPEARGHLASRVLPRPLGRLGVEQRREHALVQLGADEAEPLPQPRPLEARERGEAAARVVLGDVLQDRAVLGQELAALEPEHRHLAERVDGQEVAAVGQALGLGVDPNVLGLGARFVKGNARGHRTSERGKIQNHGACLGLG